MTALHHVCRSCGGSYPETFYRRDRRVCVGCESTQPQNHRGPRLRDKARRSLVAHAARYVRLGVAESPQDFAFRYGWDAGLMANDIADALRKPCPYCAAGYSGAADCTLDIVDPRQLPYYRTNVRWCCRACNVEKRRATPEEWGSRLEAWDRWRRRSRAWPDDSLFGTAS